MGSKMTVAHVADTKEYNHFDLYYRDGNGKIQIDRINTLAFLHERGYFLYRNNIHRHSFIRIIDNIVKEIGKKDLVDEVLNFIHKNEERSIYESFLNRVGNFFNDDFLRTLEAKEIEFRRDRKDAIQIYYQNCIVKITTQSITTHPYSSLNGYIWESQILPRDFTPVEESSSDFKTFVFNVSNKEVPRYETICSALGFLISSYKNPAYCPAIIFNDEVISDHPEGGTGKGLLIKATEKFLVTATEEGKTFNFDKNFVYQKINKDTRLHFFQDVQKNFDFERLFSVLTDGITVEKKGLESFYLPFANSPKIAITTNYAIRGAGNSHERRRFEIEISQYYHKKFTPYDEFKIMMFDEWDDKQYNEFDNFIIDCCQLYLRKGLIEQQLINLPEKRLMAELSPDFLDFIDENLLSPGESIRKSAYYQKFKDQYKNSRIASRTFYSMLKNYCEFHKIVLHEQKTNGIWHFIF